MAGYSETGEYGFGILLNNYYKFIMNKLVINTSNDHYWYYQ